MDRVCLIVRSIFMKGSFWRERSGRSGAVASVLIGGGILPMRASGWGAG
jgi:hypothetical protein